MHDEPRRLTNGPTLTIGALIERRAEILKNTFAPTREINILQLYLLRCVAYVAYSVAHTRMGLRVGPPLMIMRATSLHYPEIPCLITGKPMPL